MFNGRDWTNLSMHYCKSTEKQENYGDLFYDGIGK
jgi:hypothetical protein